MFLFTVSILSSILCCSILTRLFSCFNRLYSKYFINSYFSILHFSFFYDKIAKIFCNGYAETRYERSFTMKILRFTAPFKPKGKEYIYVGMWNRYMKNKILLLSSFIPTFCSFYFIAQGVEPRYLPVFLLVACYPIFSVGAYLLRIKQHFRYRSPLDTAMTLFTLMDNGILIEKEGQEIPSLYHWDKFNLCYELKHYLLLYHFYLSHRSQELKSFSRNITCAIYYHILNFFSNLTKV